MWVSLMANRITVESKRKYLLGDEIFGYAIVLVILDLAFLFLILLKDVGDIIQLIILGVFFLMIHFLAVAILYNKWASTPRYIGYYGVGIWADSRENMPIPKNMNLALEYYVATLPNLIKDVYQGSSKEYKITPKIIKDALEGLRIEWLKRPISVVTSIGWMCPDRFGAFKKDAILLYWNGSVEHSNLFHILNHFIEVKILNMKPDVDHHRTRWWSMIEDLKNQYIKWKSIQLNDLELSEFRPTEIAPEIADYFRNK